MADAKVQILLVEDFEPYRTVVASLLGANTHFQVVCASDGSEAVEKAMQLRPDLILMDIGLPKLNGLEAARRISELLPASRIVFLTQETDPDVAHEAFNLGAAGYVAKQKTSSDLLPVLAAVLEGTQSVRVGLAGANFQGERVRPKATSEADD